MATNELRSDFQIIIGDIFQELDKFPSKFDLIIADPPFGIDYDKSSHEYGTAGCILYEDNFEGNEYEEFSYQWISK